MRKADFFIVGAPKCGTTALHRYLRSHAELFLPQSKDRCFFGSDLISGKRLSPDEFAARFAPAEERQRVGESCVHYLYSKEAPGEIKAYNPAARIIVMLRNPVDLLAAWHSQLLYLGTEDIADLEQALAAEPERRLGRRVPDAIRVRNSLYYSEVVKLSDQVARYFDTFGRDRVLTILLDDFASATARVFRETLEFLEVNPEFQVPLRVVNANKRPRSARLHGVLARPGGFLRALGRVVMPDARLRGRVLKPVLRWNKVYEARKPLDPDLRRRLQEQFAPEVARLGTLLQRDLSAWHGGSRALVEPA